MRPDSHTQLANNRLRTIFYLFLFRWRYRFSEYKYYVPVNEL